MPRGIPNQAKNNPVKMPAPEVHTADLPIGQPPEIKMPEHGLPERGEVILVDKPLEREHADALAFAEEPITIRIEPSAEENAPLVVDCWVNGKGAEVFVNGKWLEFNCLPVGMPVTTKRKYVEVLARSKVDRIRTIEENRQPGDNEDGFKMRRSSSSKSVFSVLNDKNPKGAEWLTRLMQER